ncbi:MAG: leucine-rich repeat protein [Lachnospiraceae bacterium]|nr:leucine-rich repeat protein [Lachnospiraceae bacterium]
MSKTTTKYFSDIRMFGFSLVILLALGIFLMPAPAKAAKENTAGGKCGENLEWTLDSEGTLTISGTGEMYEYSDEEPAPWKEYAASQVIYKIEVKDGVTTIANGAFSQFWDVTEVILPDSVTAIGSTAFSSCGSLKEIRLPSGLQTINIATFGSCSSLEKIKLPDQVTVIDERAFAGCTKLKEVEWPSALESIRMKAFLECSSLSELKLPESVRAIGRKAFFKCTALTDVVLPTQLEHLEAEVFQDCTSLKQITLSAKLEWMGTDVFAGCENLEAILVHPDNPYLLSIDGVLYTYYYNQDTGTYEKDRLSLYICPNKKDGEFTAAENTVFLCGYAFAGCRNLTVITLPETLEEMGSCVFDGCSNLKKLVMSSDAPLTADGDEAKWILKGLPSDAVIYYPDGAVGYNKIPWTDYTQKTYVSDKTVSKIVLSENAVKMSVGSTLTLKAKVLPSYAKDRKLTWSTSLPDIITVDDQGTVTAVSAGTASVIVKSSNGRKAHCSVTVVPSAPKLKSAVSVRYNQIKITWNRSKGADGYYIYQKVSDGWKRIGELNDPKAVSFTHKSLTCGKSYTYTVKAFAEKHDRNYYSSYSKKGVTGKPVPSVPKLRKLSRASASSLKLTWGKVDGASGYAVYRKTSDGWKRIKTVKKGSTVTFTEKKLKKGKTYTYTVKAYRMVNEKAVYGSCSKKGISSTLK